MTPGRNRAYGQAENVSEFCTNCTISGQCLDWFASPKYASAYPESELPSGQIYEPAHSGAVAHPTPGGRGCRAGHGSAGAGTVSGKVRHSSRPGYAIRAGHPATGLCRRSRSRCRSRTVALLGHGARVRSQAGSGGRITASWPGAQAAAGGDPLRHGAPELSGVAAAAAVSARNTRAGAAERDGFGGFVLRTAALLHAVPVPAALSAGRPRNLPVAGHVG